MYVFLILGALVVATLISKVKKDKIVEYIVIEDHIDNYINKYDYGDGLTDNDIKDYIGQDIESDIEQEETINESLDPETNIRGIYVSASKAASSSIDDLINIAKTTEINAMVIDVKDDSGRITYPMESDLIKEIGSGTKYISNIEELMKTLKDEGVYTIARIVAFKDPFLGNKRPDLAIINNDGSIYGGNESWLNPYNKESWEYLLEVSKQAAAIGFDEIQFDYIRFPTGKDINKAKFPGAGDRSKEDIILEFTKYAYESLKPLGVMVSADVFGAIISSDTDGAIVGQNYSEMARYLDYICPMIYPSHFGEGNYGVAYPDLEPYNIIKKVLDHSQEKLSIIPEGEHCAIIRPWLQDFTASWIKNYQKYGGKEVREQINGVYAAGYDEWLLWNASNKYSVDGLDKPQE